ncbi:hypothetical protein EBB07_14895 [Paenibacillaceae bacterium]|nr:hypothetical protein EBB07_14895 [Paenibacillaceae bacterium]
MQIRTFKDSSTGNEIQAVGHSGSDTGQNYFTAQTWMSDSRHIVVCTDLDENMKGRYVCVDTATAASHTLLTNVRWGCGVISANDLFYYYDGAAIYEYHLHAKSNRTVCQMGGGVELFGPLSITNDGSVLGIYWRRGEAWVIGTVAVDTGEVSELIEPGFQEPYPIANHAMINPVDHQLVFFAHEGQTEQIADRIYVVHAETRQMHSLFHQKRLATGEHVEYVGHEMWAYNGEHLYFVKYPQSPLAPTGVYRVDKSGRTSEFINGDYPYWHVSLSPDGRWAVADTIDGTQSSKIVLIDLHSFSSQLLCEQPHWRDHPGHPHPMFSPDSMKVSFTFADEQQRLSIGVIDLAPLIEEGSDGREN